MTRFQSATAALLVSFSATQAFVGATLPAEPDNPALECKMFQEIYADGKDLCQRIFSDAFEYVPRTNKTAYDMAFTFWWFTADNPNDATLTLRQQNGYNTDPAYSSTDVCWLRSEGVTNHKVAPTNENNQFTECLPYKERACCYDATVNNSSVINTAYGEEYRWDRCGKLSEECERFFVQEACFYECDPNAGLFRKYSPAEVAKNLSLVGSEWELSKLPVKGDYCDAWFDACRFQKFCGDGDFFSCARIPPPEPAKTVLPPGAIAGIVIGSIVLFFTLLFLGFLIYKERRGTPVFQKINAEDSIPLKGATQSASVPGQRNSEIMTI